MIGYELNEIYTQNIDVFILFVNNALVNLPHKSIVHFEWTPFHTITAIVLQLLKPIWKLHIVSDILVVGESAIGILHFALLSLSLSIISHEYRFIVELSASSA